MTDKHHASTIHPVELDGWYERTDGTFGFYVGAARSAGPTMTQGPCRDFECVHRDERGKIYRIGWPARAALSVVAGRELTDLDGAAAELAIATLAARPLHLHDAEDSCADSDCEWAGTPHEVRS